MPALFEEGVCCAVPLFVDEAALLAGAGAAAGLLAGAADSLLAAGAVVDLLGGAELTGGAAGVAAVESVAVAFFELLFLVVAAELSDVVASVLAAVFFLDLEVVDFAESAVASVL
jgi:hypothetical protein